MAVKTWSTPAAGEEKRPVPCTLCGGARFAPRFTCGEHDIPFCYVRCTACGLVQINPQPESAAVRARYGADYLDYEKANEGAFLRLQELALLDAGFFTIERELLKKRGPAGTASSSASVTPGQPAALDRPTLLDRPTVLDIGCATGALLRSLRDRGWDVRGLEIAAPQAAYCRERGLDVRALPLEHGGFPDALFDAVLASHLIEHLNDPGAFVREAYRICKPGGRLYVTTPNIAGFQARLFGGRWRSAIFDHLYLFSIKTLGRLLERAGFRVERIRTWGGLAAGIAPVPVKRAADTLAKALGAGDVMIIRARRPAA
ncbi:MAG: class I SAM-dependent methyltransferase, partial [Treponema sp.]|nr:class I SAM-dependent methyltransferase [Treponema sp.]